MDGVTDVINIIALYVCCGEIFCVYPDSLAPIILEKYSPTLLKCGGKTLYQDNVKENASFRTLPLTKSMGIYLSKLKQKQKMLKNEFGNDYFDNDYICKWEDGRMFRPDYTTNRFREVIKTNGLKYITFHSLRHSSASLLINEGFTLKEVQEWLGHADVASTNIYSHLLYKSKENMGYKMDEVLSI